MIRMSNHYLDTFSLSLSLSLSLSSHCLSLLSSSLSLLTFLLFTISLFLNISHEWRLFLKLYKKFLLQCRRHCRRRDKVERLQSVASRRRRRRFWFRSSASRPLQEILNSISTRKLFLRVRKTFGPRCTSLARWCDFGTRRRRCRCSRCRCRCRRFNDKNMFISDRISRLKQAACCCRLSSEGDSTLKLTLI